jgi:hypothetical protein
VRRIRTATDTGGKMSAERKLLVATLALAVRDARKGRFPDAGEWLFSDRAEGVFDFVNVCEVLGIPPERVRKAVRYGGANGGAIA